MIKRNSVLALGSLLVLSAAIMFSGMGLSVSEANLAEEVGAGVDISISSAFSLPSTAYAQPDQHMESKAYLPPIKQLESGIAINDIQCNLPRELYVRQSQTPVCLYAETYNSMQGRGMDIEPATVMSSDTFSPEELEWLADNPVIRVSYNSEWVPIEYADESGSLQGVTLDYVAEFEAISGADLVYIPAADTWADALKTVEDRNADVMFMVVSTPERLEYMDFTTPHYSIKTFLVSLEDGPLSIDDNDDLTLITIRGYAIESWLDQNHPDTQYISVDSHSEGFELLKSGDADAFASTWPVAVHYAKLSGVDSIYNAGFTGHQYDLAVGYRNDMPILGSILQKTLNQIPQQKIDGWYDAVSQTTNDREKLESIVREVIEDTISLYNSDPANAFELITSMQSTSPHYPFVVDPLTATMVAHGSIPEHVGKTSVSLTKSNLPLDVILSDLKEGDVWTEYVFTNPSTGAEQAKRSLYVLHDGYIFSSGYYLTQELDIRAILDEVIANYVSDPQNSFEQINSMVSTDPSYPFVFDFETSTIVAHGSDPGLVGTSTSSVVADRPSDVVASDLLQGPTWVKYTFKNPLTGIDQSKRTLLILHDGYVFGSGYYTELAPAEIFSSDEIKWLLNNPIRVSYDSGWVPIEYVDESGNLQGVTLDYVAEFEAVSGADLVYIPAADTLADALKPIEDRDADIIFMVASTPERLEYMDFTTPHYSIKTFLVSLEDGPLSIDDNDDLTLITIRGYAIESWLDQNHPDTQYISVDSHSEGFELLKSGDADAFASTWPVAVHYAKLSGIDSIYNAGFTGHQYDLAVGYRNDVPILGSILQKTLDHIPQQKIDGWYDAVSQTTDDPDKLESIVRGVIEDSIALYDSNPANAFDLINSMQLINPQYPFVMDYLSTRIVAHGSIPERQGEIAIALTESNVPLDVILSDLKEGSVWAEYVFANPSTGIEQAKRSLYVLHDGYIFASGYYIESSSSPATGVSAPRID